MHSNRPSPKLSGSAIMKVWMFMVGVNCGVEASVGLRERADYIIDSNKLDIRLKHQVIIDALLGSSLLQASYSSRRIFLININSHSFVQPTQGLCPGQIYTNRRIGKSSCS